jgi:hypothetical protein
MELLEAPHCLIANSNSPVQIRKFKFENQHSFLSILGKASANP